MGASEEAVQPSGATMPPPLRLKPASRQVGFAAPAADETSPSSVLQQRRGGEEGSPTAHTPAATAGQRPAADCSPRAAIESPSALAAALRRDKSLPSLALPKLKLGLRTSKGMPKSKSSSNLRSAAAAVPEGEAVGSRSATSSPVAPSSAGSEPLSRPFNIPRGRRTASVDFDASGGPGGDDDDVASTPVISAASSLLDRHLSAAVLSRQQAAQQQQQAAQQGGGHGSAGGSERQGSGSMAASPAGSGMQLQLQQLQRTQSGASATTKDLYVAQADAVTAHAQVLSLQSALKKEQEEVTRLREQLELMTAERDRLLAEVCQGGEPAVFVLDRASMDALAAARNARAQHYQPPPPPVGGTAAAALAAAGGPPPLAAGMPPRPRSGLRFRLPP